MEVALLLLEHGADASAQDEDKATPLHSASRRGHVGVARVFLERGVDANAHDKNKSTPLHWASRDGHVEVTRVLLKYGADACAQDGDRLTPLNLALRCTCYIGFRWTPASICKHLEVALVLLEHAVDSNVLNIFGSAPLQEAERDFLSRNYF